LEVKMTAGAVHRDIDTLPRVGVRGLARDRGRFFRPLGQHSPLRGLGERFLIDVPFGPKMVVTSSPEDAKAVFADRDGSLSFGELLKRFSPHERLFGSDAFIFLEGEAHMEEKRKVAPPLHGKALKSYEQAMTDIVMRRLPEWPLGERVEFCDIGGQLSLDVMMKVIFGVSKPERMQRLERAMLAHCAVTESRCRDGLDGSARQLGGGAPGRTHGRRGRCDRPRRNCRAATHRVSPRRLPDVVPGDQPTG
jgi:cytochrome P450 family 135